MGTLFGFIVGYVLGARAGSQRFDEVVGAARAVRDSEEFKALLQVARIHAVGTVTMVSDRLAATDEHSAEDLIARAEARARG